MLAATAARPLFASRVQFVACVAPLANVPNTIVTAAAKLIGCVGAIFARPGQPPTSRVAIHIDTTSSANISGTDTRESASIPR
ncbi:hypothetical protein DM78_4942 [Burkholderia mallei]|nr:hypothetical protein DM78_4942 [Burkholderia mallei]